MKYEYRCETCGAVLSLPHPADACLLCEERDTLIPQDTIPLAEYFASKFAGKIEPIFLTCFSCK